jgi:hypothetical protein
MATTKLSKNRSYSSYSTGQFRSEPFDGFFSYHHAVSNKLLQSNKSTNVSSNSHGIHLGESNVTNKISMKKKYLQKSPHFS